METGTVGKDQNGTEMLRSEGGLGKNKQEERPESLPIDTTAKTRQHLVDIVGPKPRLAFRRNEQRRMEMHAVGSIVFLI